MAVGDGEAEMGLALGQIALLEGQPAQTKMGTSVRWAPAQNLLKLLGGSVQTAVCQEQLGQLKPGRVWILVAQVRGTLQGLECRVRLAFHPHKSLKVGPARVARVQSFRGGKAHLGLLREIMREESQAQFSP